MLVSGRPKMTARAVQSFIAQTYENKYLLLWDTGDPHYAPPFVYDPHFVEIWHRSAGPSIGQLRNEAIAETRCDMVAHFDSDDLWDDDDWSHPNRLAEQVALLQDSGRECVGYREVLFWNTRKSDGEAWIYRNPFDPSYCVGASLMYYRSVWERRPFEHVSKGEDTRWLMGVKSLGVSGLHGPLAQNADAPRLICQIHAGSTSQGTPPKEKKAEWERAPQWDAYCRERMVL